MSRWSPSLIFLPPKVFEIIQNCQPVETSAVVVTLQFNLNLDTYANDEVNI